MTWQMCKFEAYDKYHVKDGKQHEIKPPLNVIKLNPDNNAYNKQKISPYQANVS